MVHSRPPSGVHERFVRQEEANNIGFRVIGYRACVPAQDGVH